jgi:hypothetical protein
VGTVDKLRASCGVDSKLSVGVSHRECANEKVGKAGEKVGTIAILPGQKHPPEFLPQIQSHVSTKKNKPKVPRTTSTTALLFLFLLFILSSIFFSVVFVFLARLLNMQILLEILIHCLIEPKKKGEFNKNEER